VVTTYPTSSALNVFMPPIAQNKKFHVEANTLIFWPFIFNTMLMFVTILSSLVNILVFLLFPIFRHSWCCLCVFLLLIKLKSFPNQNITLIKIVIKDVWIWECLLGWHSS
jgi:hypothetical protein